MRKAIFLLSLCMAIAINAQAQLTRVSGVVIGHDDDSPLAGATVKVVGTSIAVPTNIDGEFTITGLKPGMKQILVTYVGYEPKTVDIKPDMKIYLEVANNMMDEVIVVAFGKQKRESFTGSASVLTADQLSQQQVTNPIEALDGRIAGLNMTSANGFTDSPTISVRGISSIYADNDPLIILDGLPYNGYWNDINPNDVESITVLKDAASNALYGARGANGVILITTKNGQRGKTSVILEAKLGVNTDARVKYDTVDDPGQYYIGHYNALRNYYINERGQLPGQAHITANNIVGGDYTAGGLGYMAYTIPNGEYLIGTNGKLNPNAVLGNRVAKDGKIYTLYPDNWYDNGTRNGLRQEYNARITGGNDRFTMLASLGYLEEEGLAYGNDISRFSARLKTDYQAYSWLRVGGTASYNHKVTNSSEGVFGTAYTIAPVYPLYVRDADGKILTDSHGPVFDYGAGNNGGMIRPQENNGNSIQDDLLNITNNNSNAFNLQGYATADLTHGFSLTVNGSIYVTENRMKYGYQPYYGYDVSAGGTVTTYHYRTTDVNYQQLLNYNNTFGKHNVSALLGHEYYKTSQTSLKASRSKVAIYDQNTEINGAIIDRSMSGGISRYNVEGFLFRGQYDYDSRYFASASFRRDGSSRFHPDHCWGNFWSLGGAWIISRESWFPKHWTVNMLKVKLSYGEQGNDKIGSYKYVDTYNIKNSNDEIAYVFDAKGNPNITWETVGSLNAGVEFELFNNRLSGSVEYYNRTTSDMLMYVSSPYSVGYGGYYSNIGDMENTGIEAEIKADIITLRDFSWSVNLNLAWQKNKVTKLPASSKKYNMEGYDGFISGETFIGEGLPMYTWYLPTYAGVGEKGEALYYTTNADGELVPTSDYSAATYRLCGSALPDVFGGFGTTIKAYGVDLTANFAFSIGGKKYDSAYQNLMSPPFSSNTGLAFHKDIFNAWTPENTNTDIPRWQYNDTYAATFCDRFLTDASYLSFKNVTLGYTFPKSLTKRIKIERLRIYGACENVAYWTARKGFDPRVGTMYGSYGGVSPMRSVSAGINIQF